MVVRIERRTKGVDLLRVPRGFKMGAVGCGVPGIVRFGAGEGVGYFD